MQAGKIWRSTTGGQSWTELTIPDPDNAFEQTPAPTAATVSFLQRVDNIHVNKSHYVTAEYDDGSIVGGWLLATNDDGADGSWTWKPLGSAADNSTFTFPSDAQGWVFSEYDDSGGDSVGVWDAAVGRTAPGSLRIDLLPKTGFLFQAGVWRYYPPSAIYAQSGDTVTAWAQGPGSYCYDNWLRIVYKDGTTDGHVESNYSGWLQLTATVSAGNSGKQVDHVWMLSSSGAGCGPPQGTISGRWDDVVFNFSGTDIRPLWADVDSQDGSTLYVTCWKGNDTLVLQKRQTSNLALVSEYSLGSCTAAQLAAKTYVAYVYTPTYDKSTCYCFGRLNNPQGLGNPSHLIRTTNGGAAWTLLENGFGADHIGCFRAEGATPGARTFYAIRNIAAAAAKLYTGVESLVYRLDTPFTAGVNVDAMTVSNGQVAVGANAASATMIAVAESPWGGWTNLTGSFPGAEVRSLTYI